MLCAAVMLLLGLQLHICQDLRIFHTDPLLEDHWRKSFGRCLFSLISE